jgi:RNA polymerase sigma-70 factor (ECF subfamily)
VGAELADIERVYRDGYERFVRVAHATVGDAWLAVDAVQEGFAHAVHSRSSFRGECPLDAWIWRIVLNAAYRQARGSARDGSLDRDEPARADGAGSERESAVRTSIALLPERQRLVLFLRYYADLDYGAIARVLEIRPGTVAAALHKAHATLRSALEETTV